MLTISSHQMQLFNTEIKNRFATKLTGQLGPEYPEWFQPLPQGLAERIVAGKINYAEERYKIRYQNALTTYLHYCCAIGPGFDLQPEIQSFLDDSSLYPDDIPDLLPGRVSDEAWSEAEQQVRRNAWFYPDSATLTDQVAARTCWALAELAEKQSNIKAPSDELSLKMFILQSMQAAHEHQIDDAMGMTAFAVCQIILGKDFYLKQTKSWLTPIFHDPAILPELRGATLVGCTELEWGIEL